MVSVDRLQGLSGDLGVKCPVRVATTANITLSGLQTIDGITVVADDRVLVKNQTDAADNGIWVATTSSWSRALDFDAENDAVAGTMVIVSEGTTNGGQIFRVSNTGSITIGTTLLTWANAFLSTFFSSVGSSLIGFIQSGTGAVLRTIQDWMREYPSITDYGAVGDDSTINTDAINAALAAHDILIVPAGTFLTAGEHDITGKTLIGKGRSKSIIKLSGTNTNANLFKNGSTSATAWGSGGECQLEKIGLRGNWDGSTAQVSSDVSVMGALLKWYSGAHVRVVDCAFNNFYGFGAFFYRLGYSRIVGNRLTTGAANALHFQGVSGADAITSTNVQDNVINTISGTGATGGNGIAITEGFSVQLQGNIIESAVNGVRIAGSDNRSIELRGNHMENNSGADIDYVGTGYDLGLYNNILASATALSRSNPEFQTYAAIGNYGLDDNYTLPVLSAAATEVTLNAASPKKTLNSLTLTPGNWHITAGWAGNTGSGAGQMSARQEFGLNTAASLPSYSSTLAYPRVRGDCTSTVDTADGFMNETTGFTLRVTSGTQTVYLYGGPESITNTLEVLCTSWIRAVKINGDYTA